MRKLLLPLLCIPTLLLFAFSLKPKSGTDDLISRIVVQLQKFHALFPQESIYLHQDKSLYSLGETIWFKAYAPQNANDSLSSVLYVDLIGPDNHVKYLRKLKLQDGVAHGDIYLPDTLSEGLYQIRAYTNRMRNQADDALFTREITVSNTSLSDPKASVSFITKPAPGGDSVITTLQVYSHPFEPVKNFKLKAHLLVNGKKAKATQHTTDSEGRVILPFYFDKTKTGSITEASLIIQSEDKNNPFKRSYHLPIGKPMLDLQFFPEGGHLVNGLVSLVAFKAINIHGSGEQVTGAVYDQDQNKVTDIKSEHLGMGAFKLKPEAGKIYTAKVKLKNGETAAYELPAAKTKGVVLEITRPINQSINIRIENNLSGSSLDPMYLVAHAADSVLFALTASSKNDVLETAIPTSRFPAGIVYFTLFDSKGNPLSERLTFINHPPKLNLTINTDKKSYGKRQKVKMHIEAKDESGNPVSGNFSLAVRDALNDLNEKPYANNLQTQMHLSSHLKGNIEQPAYYFEEKQPKALRHLDLLLLTQGWRRYNWPDILTDKFQVNNYLAENSIAFTGYVEKEFGKKGPQESNLAVILKPIATKDSSVAIPTFVMAKTSSDGRFHITGLDFQDTLQVFIQARTLKGGTNRVIHLNTTPPPAPTFYTTEDGTITGELIVAYRNRMRGWSEANRQYRLASGAIQLGQVEVTTKKPELGSAYRIYSVQDVDKRIELKKFKASFPNILDYLAGSAAGVQVYYSGPYRRVLIRGNTTVPAKEGEPTKDLNTNPLFLLDGMRVDIETVNSLSPNEIEAIEIIKNNTTIFGANGSNGVIALFTKRGNPNYDYSNDKTGPGTLSFKLAGYNKPATFYVPRYDVPEDRHNLPDYRSTLHWQPNVVTDKNGKAVITFFTSDISTEFVAICEGLSQNGIVGTTSYKFNSENVGM